MNKFLNHFLYIIKVFRFNERPYYYCFVSFTVLVSLFFFLSRFLKYASADFHKTFRTYFRKLYKKIVDQFLDCHFRSWDIKEFCLWLIFLNKFWKIKLQVFRIGRESPAAVSLAYPNVRWQLHSSPESNKWP